jgi:hypothetical protein
MSNGELPKSMPKKRGRWDQTGGDEGVTPTKKKATSNSVSSVGSSWDKEDVRFCFILSSLLCLLHALPIYFSLTSLFLIIFGYESKL